MAIINMVDFYMKTKHEQAQEKVKDLDCALAKAKLELKELDNVKYPQEGEYFSGLYFVAKGNSASHSTKLFRDFNKEKVAKISSLENMIQRALRQTADELCPDFVADVSDDKQIYFIETEMFGFRVECYAHCMPLGAVGFDTLENTQIAISRVEPMYEELKELWELS